MLRCHSPVPASNVLPSQWQAYKQSVRNLNTILQMYNLYDTSNLYTTFIQPWEVGGCIGKKWEALHSEKKGPLV